MTSAPPQRFGPPAHPQGFALVELVASMAVPTILRLSFGVIDAVRAFRP
jgi:hypothetical protein